jgi:hypothetical protein
MRQNFSELFKEAKSRRNSFVFSFLGTDLIGINACTSTYRLRQEWCVVLLYVNWWSTCKLNQKGMAWSTGNKKSNSRRVPCIVCRIQTKSQAGWKNTAPGGNKRADWSLCGAKWILAANYCQREARRLNCRLSRLHLPFHCIISVASQPWILPGPPPIAKLPIYSLDSLDLLQEAIKGVTPKVMSIRGR